MKLDRESIVRTDFPSGRPGWSRSAVEAHLEQIAAAVGEAGLGSAGSEPAPLSSHIQGILDAADAAATEIKAQAQAQAEKIRQQVLAPAEQQRAEVAGAAQALVARVEAIEAELATLFADLRTRGIAIGASIAELELESGTVPATGRPPEVAEPPAVDGTPAAHGTPAVAEPPAAAGTPAIAEPPSTVTHPPAASSVEQPGAPAVASQHGETGDPHAARLVALDMALSGDSREEIEAYLAAHFAVADQSALVDEVLAAAGG